MVNSPLFLLPEEPGLGAGSIHTSNEAIGNRHMAQKYSKLSFARLNGAELSAKEPAEPNRPRQALERLARMGNPPPRGRDEGT
jgi:hypothetical protein